MPPMPPGARAATRPLPTGDVMPVPMLDGITRRSSIRGILLLILVVSLLPMLALSTWHGFSRLAHDREARNRQLLEAAELTSATELNVIGGARAILQVLAVAPSVRSRAPDRCGPILEAAARAFPAYRQFAISGRDGSLACRSDQGSSSLPAIAPPLWQRLQQGEFVVTAPDWEAASQRPVLHAILPLATAAGEFDGIITASIDLDWLRDLLRKQHAAADVAVALVDGDGRPVATSRPLPWPRLSIGATDAGADSSGVFKVRGPDGRRWAYAVAPLHLDTGGGTSFYIVYAAAQPARFSTEWWLSAGYFLLPLLALLLSSAAIWYGANRAILRWISHLGALARQIGSSEAAGLRHPPSFADAPSEVRALAVDLLRMSNTITDREQRLRRSVTTQSAVALELHHRVRNNLQVMASFLSLQTETMPAGEARQALEQAQLRVATMAMVNHVLYADAEVATVTMAQLLDPIAELLARHTGVNGKVVVDQKLAPRVVDIDRAMPLSLWIIEAAVCLYERADPDKRPHLFTISITNENDVMCIVVTMSGLLPDARRSSLHRRLVAAIAHQLGGRSRIDDVGVSEGKIVLCLPHDDAAGDAGCASETTPAALAQDTGAG